MKYWKLFAHPYAFGREDMPAVSSQMELTKVARDLLFSLTISIIIVTLSMWAIGSVARFDMLPSISLFITLWMTGAIIAAQIIPQAAILWGLRLIGEYKNQSFSIFMIYYGRLTSLFFFLDAIIVASSFITIMIAYHPLTNQAPIFVLMLISYGVALFPLIHLAVFLWFLESV
jgi:hypothetical protein